MNLKAVLLSVVLLCASLLPGANDICYARGVKYYRVIDDNTYLYTSPTLEQKYFLLANTYFVQVLDSVSDKVAHVMYDGIEGYVQTDNMLTCYSIPDTPYPTQKLDVQDVCNVVLYDAPNDSAHYVGIVPFNAQDIQYYGCINSQEAISGLGDMWYYVKYCSFEQGVLCGYVYAPLTKNLSVAQPNLEVVSTQDEQTVDANALPVSNDFGNADNLFIIVGLCALALVLLYLLFKTDKRKKRKNAPINNMRRDKLTYMAKHNENDEFDF